MTRFPTLALAVSLAGGTLALATLAQAPAQQAPAQQAPPPQGAAPRPGLPPPSPEMQQFIADVRKQIAGKENQPAGEVFKNLQVLKDMPANRILPIMRVAYAGSLGVECTHCHVANAWEKDDKEAKGTARKMWAFMRETNEKLGAIKQGAGVNCTTCHRGQTKPALDLSQR